MTETDFEPAHQDMGRHIVSGILGSGMVQIVKVACQFLSVIVLSRLLPPADFGLIAMVSPVFAFVTLFQDLGLSQATIQKPSITHDEINAFFWINVGIGAVLTVLVIAVSPLVGWYYNEPRVVPLTAAMGLLIVIGSLGNQHGAVMTRRMEFRALALNGMIGAVSGVAVSIILALTLKTYWALYWGMAAAIVAPVIAIWFASRWRPSRPRLVAGLRDMLRFGAGVTSANLSSYLSMNTDNILIGWKWGGEALGFYDRAYKLLLFPIQRIVGPVMNTMVPVLSRLQDEPERYRRVVLKTLAQLTMVTWPGIIWAIVLNETLVPTLLGKQWAGSSPVFAALAIAGLVQVVNYAMGGLYISQGRSGELARWSFFGAVIDVASFGIGLPFGAVGVATAYAVSEYIRTPFFWRNVTRSGPIRAGDVVRAVTPQAISACVSLAAVFLYRSFVQASPILLLIGGLGVAYVATAVTMGLSQGGRETLGHTLDVAHRLVLRVRKMSNNPD